ncbi:hypothetical protein OIDMADRAFT_37997 [Oidiodendron maius Zn]|uniref:Fumarylacetoacetase-like C-terminal domain-containing protein n=1 Tax=Oidiodendron maius (strain Zn) TaxID=913774 RepID=A0A0C3I464_OIDMZ|nr:hypothetical protein OIDMADRAFT_37997 [Oidiodendron maius Zn]
MVGTPATEEEVARSTGNRLNILQFESLELIARITFQRLVCYQVDGRAFFGNLLESTPNGHKVRTLQGDIFGDLEATGDTLSVPNLLCPLELTPIIQCVCLNYNHHAQEANLTVPTYPVIFTKPFDALVGPTDHVPIHADAQAKLDFEENSLPDASGGQYCYAKSFDGFAPIGPAIWSKEVVSDPQKLKYKALENGEVLHETETGDMIWTVKQIIVHLSRGTTVRKGTVIMTGTSGVGFFRNRYLKDGDIVAVEVEGLGGNANKMKFI